MKKRKCWIACTYVAYDVDTEDGGYIQGIRCRKCGHERSVTKVTPKGAEIQRELEKLRKIGYANTNDGYDHFINLQEQFRREVHRL